VFVKAGGLDDRLYALQANAKKIVYSHETALFLHGLTDRVPLAYSVTVPSAYKPSAKLKETCKVYFIKPELHGLGIAEIPSGMGHTIAAYNRERTICDILRSRNRIDIQILTGALKRYTSLKDTDLNLLASYAGRFGVQRLLQPYLEVLV
jgi:predicted transcriptional regulator of viral defense system